MLLALASAVLGPRSAFADGAFTIGMEAKSVLDQKLVLSNSPAMTRTRIDSLTQVSTTRSTNYFKDLDSVNGSTTTSLRSWDQLSGSGSYLFLKGSFATEYIEAILRLGAANKRIDHREKATTLTSKGGQPDVSGQSSDESTLVELPQGFAYGFNVRGEPYQTDDFIILLDAHFTQIFNKGNKSQSFAVNTTTTGVVLSQNASQNLIDFDERLWGLTASVSMRLESFHPYLGLSYDDGILKGTNQLTTNVQTYANGALTGGATTIENLQYILKPKSKVSLVLGLSFPFERGGVTIEGRMQGETSLAVGGFIAF